jgi:hypothetical protein
VIKPVLTLRDGLLLEFSPVMLLPLLWLLHLKIGA